MSSAFTCSIATKRLPTIRVFGTKSVSITRVHGVHFLAPKYSAAAAISSSVMAFASTPMVGVLGFRGAADTRAPLRTHPICRMK